MTESLNHCRKKVDEDLWDDDSGYELEARTSTGEDSVSRTLLDGFKIIDNAEIFKY